MTAAHYIGLVLLAFVAYLFIGEWVLGEIERWWNRRKREKMRWR